MAWFDVIASGGEREALLGSPAARPPVQGKPSAFEDLLGRHFRSHRVATA
jgi:hypothetical protein